MHHVADSAPLLSPEERRQRNREEVRRAILEAARGVMREQGVAALSLREVARRVRMQAPSLYAYFPSKAALYDSLFLIGIRRWVEYRNRADDEHDMHDDFWEWLQGRVESYMRFAQENPELYQLAFERPVPGFVPSEESMVESRQMLAGLEQVLAAAIADGRIAPDIPVSQARDMVIAVAHGLTSQHMANEPNVPVGSGRFGSLVPAAIALFRASWEPQQSTSTQHDRGHPGSGEIRPDGYSQTITETGGSADEPEGG